MYMYIPNMMSFAPCTHDTSNIANRYRDTCIVIQVIQMTALRFLENKTIKISPSYKNVYEDLCTTPVVRTNYR